MDKPTGFYIEGKAITPEIAESIDKLILSTNINANSAVDFLFLRACLQRIISGVDVVAEMEEKE